MGRWTIELKTTGKVLGWCGLKRHEKGDVDLGFRIFRKHWNKGFATEAAKANIEYRFRTLKLNSIIANHQEGNLASKRVLEKLGFKFSHSFTEDGKIWHQYSLSDLAT